MSGTISGYRPIVTSASKGSYTCRPVPRETIDYIIEQYRSLPTRRPPAGILATEIRRAETAIRAVINNRYETTWTQLYELRTALNLLKEGADNLPFGVGDPYVPPLRSYVRQLDEAIAENCRRTG